MKLSRNKQPRLTFMYHNQDSNYSRDNDTYRQQNSNQQSYRQGSHRQNSSRSQTYSNNRTVSNNASNNPSANTRKKTVSPSATSNNNVQFIRETSGHSNSHSHSAGHQNASPGQPVPIRVDKVDSDPQLTEKVSQMRMSTRKKSTRTNTKISILNQMSGFAPFTIPENPIYINIDYGLSKFESMKQFKVFYPHNNYEKVITRLNKFKAMDRKYQRYRETSPYTATSFAAKKIRLMKKLLDFPFTGKGSSELRLASSRDPPKEKL